MKRLRRWWFLRNRCENCFGKYDRRELLKSADGAKACYPCANEILRALGYNRAARRHFKRVKK